MLVKICGLTSVKEAEYLNAANADFAGMVMYFPKSKRNVDLALAADIISALNEKINKVAVTVSPTVEQVCEIQKLGFDYIQIHGNLSEDVCKAVRIPILKAFNVNDLGEYEKWSSRSEIAGFVFDAVGYGSGKTFDWSILSDIPESDKLFILAGGLDPDNVAEAVKAVRPDGVDVSSGVESDNGSGKDLEKIKKFVIRAKNA